MEKKISPEDLRWLMDNEQTYALFDVREAGEYNAQHISYATSLPLRDIEFRLATLVSAPSTRVVLYDDLSGRAELSAKTLRLLGYDQVRVLEGGLAAWATAGYPTSSGVNVPSKEFGEKVHVEYSVPELTAEELRARLEKGERVLIWDVRTPEEYSQFTIPGASNVPGGNLIQYAYEISQKPETRVVIHCAGRTRSIIGTQSLRRLGLKNVYALRNGTMGWLLAGFELERQIHRQSPVPSSQGIKYAETLAAQIVQQEKISLISAQELEGLVQQRTRQPVYVIDVRSAEEFASGHIPSSLSVPGGQAIQRANDYVAVRAAPVVFACDNGARSVMAAYWYRKMGFTDVRVLERGLRSWLESGRELENCASYEPPLGLKQARAVVHFVESSEVVTQLSRCIILDVGKSSDYASGHIPGAQWLSRGWLEAKIPTCFPDHDQSIVMTCPDGLQSTLAARSLKELGYKNVSVVTGGVEKWKREGRSIETGLSGALMEPNDVVIPASMSGDRDVMLRYLNWESELGNKYRTSKG